MIFASLAATSNLIKKDYQSVHFIPLSGNKSQTIELKCHSNHSPNIFQVLFWGQAVSSIHIPCNASWKIHQSCVSERLLLGRCSIPHREDNFHIHQTYLCHRNHPNFTPIVIGFFRNDDKNTSVDCFIHFSSVEFML